jgi:hypothetical protein
MKLSLVIREKLSLVKSNSDAQKNKLRTLEEKISNHFTKICSQFPALGDENIPSSGIALASSYSRIRSNDPQFITFCSHELDIRVGHGHDLLQLVRNAVVLHHHYSIQYAHTRGIAQMEKIAKSQSKSSKKKASHISDYTKNWRRIQRLMDMIGEADAARLKGLQELDATNDAKYFSSLGLQTGPFLADHSQNVSWIWQVAMLDNPDCINSLTVSSREEEWASEGEKLTISKINMRPILT